MKTLIAAAALASWGYSGFATDPTKPQASRPGASPTLPAAPPVAPKPEAPPAPAAAPTPAPTKPPVSSPPRDSRPAAAPKASAPPAPARPTVWRLSDASGQVWEHADAEWLRRWVSSRNASLTARRAAPPVSYAASACSSGRCPRPR
jgi:outer membrane biosynthesis protein TonB